MEENANDLYEQKLNVNNIYNNNIQNTKDYIENLVITEINQIQAVINDLDSKLDNHYYNILRDYTVIIN